MGEVGGGMSRQLSRTKSERGEEAGGTKEKATYDGKGRERAREAGVCVKERVCERAREKDSKRAREHVFVWERTTESKRAKE